MTEGERKYLAELSLERAGKIIHIQPYDPKIAGVARRVMVQISNVLPDADVRFMGASALCISGQNDIDVYVLSPAEYQAHSVSQLTSIFGAEQKRAKWNWLEDGFEVSVWVRDPNTLKIKEQLRIFELFSTRPDILKEYEALKCSCNGKTYFQYQVAKYDFYNRVLGIE